MSLELDQACVERAGQMLLKSVSLHAAAGRMTGLLGPNGAGKTTAIRALLGLQPLSSGRALVMGHRVDELRPKQRGRLVSYLPQTRHLAWPISVREAVALGRFAYGGPLGRLGPTDQSAIEEALDRCDLSHLSHRTVISLSGGELARVHLARALVTGAPALIADEPTTALDPGHALDMLALLKAQAHSGQTVLVVLHDLHLAARFCDDIIMLDQGAMVVQAAPSDALSTERLAQIYGVGASWVEGQLQLQNRIASRPSFFPSGQKHR
jgi:iron complex transport system ATP-binding protein